MTATYTAFAAACEKSGVHTKFIPDYYKYELGWNLNDTHGTGIVMLGGIEVQRLTDFIAGK